MKAASDAKPKLRFDQHAAEEKYHHHGHEALNSDHKLLSCARVYSLKLKFECIAEITGHSARF